MKEPLSPVGGSSASGSEGPVRLKKRISLFNGCAIIVGVIVGSGIFISPGGVVKEVGSVGMSLVVWLLCGVYSMLGALSYAELGTTIPKSGGDYTYIHEAFGPLPAFLFLWIALVIVNPTSLALIALTCAQYAIKPFFPDSAVPSEPVRLLAAWIILALTALNCYKVRWATRTQDVSSVFKIGALCVIVGAALVYLSRGHTELLSIENATLNSRYRFDHMALAFYSGVFSFSGYNYLNFITEELKDPNKNLPRAIYISIPVVTLIYVLVNCAYFMALTAEEVASSDAVAALFASRAMGPLAWLIPIFVVCSCIGSLNGILLTCSRMFFAGARNGQLPELLAMISLRTHTPVVSIAFLGVSSLVMLIINDLQILINYLAFSESAIVTMSVAGLLKMRFCDHKRDRPIKLHILVPLVFFVFSVCILVAPFAQQPKELIAAVILISSGVPVYFLFVRWQSKPTCITRPWTKVTHALQAIFLCVLGDE